MERRRRRVQNTDVWIGGVLFGLCLFFCWFEIGRFGVFGSTVDWISQHSVIPEYFRQQFYDTGKLFSEFAPGLGGGQNSYNFAYYGLYSPLILPSYLLPSVRMGDYLMAVSMLAAAASSAIFYGWLRSQKLQRGISFWTALLFTLSGPLIFQSARQVMFVNYMPFLCMALWGVDRFLRRGKPGVYLLGVFLMIMTSFYYSVGGMLALVIYGLCRYQWHREHPQERCAFSGKKRDALRLLMPLLAAVLQSAFFLLPTAAALAGKRGGGAGMDASLFLPELSLFRHLYSAYGAGLTTLLLTAVLSGLFGRKASSRILAWSSAAVMTVPIVMWLLNGGLYVREKALIPFLPLFCYEIACYCTREEQREPGRKTLWRGILSYFVTCFLLWRECGYSAGFCLSRIAQLPEKIQNVTHLALADRWMLVLLDALLMPGWYILCRVIRRIRGRKRHSGLLPVLPVLFLILFGASMHHTLGVVDREFYEQVNQTDIGKSIQRVIDLDDGFYRIEQIGSSARQAADINRVWNKRQYISSIYSSSYNSAYQNFRMDTFDVEEPAGNFMMQRVSENPVFRKLMGVRYLVKVWENPKLAADRENSPFGYEWYLQEGCVAVYKNENTAPICYATDRLITEEAYEALEFPLNQTILEQYAVTEEKEGGGLSVSSGPEEDGKGLSVSSGPGEEGSGATVSSEPEEEGSGLPASSRPEEVRLSLPELETEAGRIEKTETGYRISAKKTLRLHLQLSGTDQNDVRTAAEEEQVLYLQFQIKNRKPGTSLSVWVNGVQNTVSSASSAYFYYNHNTTFTYAVPMTDSVSVTFGKGSCEITDIRAFAGAADTECGLYQSEFLPDWTKTKGNCISGQIDVRSDGCFVTSIPYDEGFAVKVDGKPRPVETVNTAFVGFSIEEGHHSVELVYHAPGAAAGKLVSLLGLLLTFLLCYASRRSRAQL